MQGRRHGVDWVDMSTPLLPEVVPEIDANPVSFYTGGGGVGSWGIESLQNMENDANLLLALSTKS